MNLRISYTLEGPLNPARAASALCNQGLFLGAELLTSGPGCLSCHRHLVSQERWMAQQLRALASLPEFAPSTHAGVHSSPFGLYGHLHTDGTHT